ncbi:MAG: peptide ABC transporter substrate-binding protein [Clostridiales bacterium]|nr:peptide ABC transporter substrate-binding protein [Clostridiales bacterium]
MRKIVALLLTLVLCASLFVMPAVAEESFELAVCLASEPQTIDPQLNSAVDGAVMAQHFFEGLYKWVDSGAKYSENVGVAALELGQAKDVTVSEDGLVYTFTLRDDIKWSDGKDVTANDFVYSWQRLVDPATAADYNYMIDMVVNANEIMAGELAKEELGVKALDDKTFEVTLAVKCAFFNEICAFPATLPIRQDIIETAGDQWTFDTATFITNGAYTMTAWEHNSYIEATSNPNYYANDAAGPQSIKFMLMDDHNAMYAAYRAGDLNFIEEVPADEIAALLDSGELVVDPYIGTYYVCFQNQKAPFDNALVREAFLLTIDRPYIVEQITQTGQIPAGGYVPTGIADAAAGSDFRANGGDYYDPSEEAYAANCDKARELLAEAGYPGGEGFPVVEYLYNTSDAHKAVGEALQNMWSTELGVTVTLQNEEWNTFLQTRKDGNYSIARNGWIADYNDPMSFLDMWVTGGGNNDAQYSNAEYDALIAAAKASSDAEERMTLMHQAEDLVIGQDKALGPIYFYTNKHMLQGFTGLYMTPLGYFFFGSTQAAE